ncbi:MAG: DUF4149 domain-containing protein [Zoogloeaceae bacterium]|jgi:hypothetical protein|nr:DUF4149 domain-containing protein [Zoogloeaceae bacterium]
MRFLANALFQIALTAWVGGLWIVGYLVVPVLFHHLSDRMLAGQIAGEIFRIAGWTGMALGGYLAFFLLVRQRYASLKTLSLWLVVLMLLLSAVSLFGIQPLMEAMKQEVAPLDVMLSSLRDRFVFWHGISSSLYLLQSLLGLGLLLRVGFPAPAFSRLFGKTPEGEL